MCCIVWGGGAWNILVLLREIQSKVRSIVMQVSEEKECEDVGRKIRKLAFATTLNHCFSLKLGIKLLQTTNTESHMLTFKTSTMGEKNLVSKKFLLSKIP